MKNCLYIGISHLCPEITNKLKVDLKVREWQFATLFLLGFTWGSSFILMDLGTKSYTGVEVALIRLASSFLFLFPFLLHRYRHIPVHRYKYLFISGLLGNGLPAFLFAISIERNIDSSLAGILNASVPVFTMIVGFLFFSLNVRRAGVWGILVGLTGTIYLIVSNVEKKEDSNYIIAILPLIASICYAFSTNVIKKELKDLPAVVVTGAALTFVGPPSIIYMLFTGTFDKMVASPANMHSLVYIVILGIVGTSLAVLVFNYLIKETTVLFATSVTYLVPMFAMGWGFVNGEGITIHYFIGMALILFGVYLTNKAK